MSTAGIILNLIGSVFAGSPTKTKRPIKHARSATTLQRKQAQTQQPKPRPINLAPSPREIQQRQTVLESVKPELASEMVLQELERGGYGGVALRHTGRTPEHLATSTGLPVQVAFSALLRLRQHGLAAYQVTELRPDQRTWVPVRGLEESPYTFSIDGDLPPRIDFVGAVIAERRRKRAARKPVRAA